MRAGMVRKAFRKIAKNPVTFIGPGVPSGELAATAEAPFTVTKTIKAVWKAEEGEEKHKEGGESQSQNAVLKVLATDLDQIGAKHRVLRGTYTTEDNWNQAEEWAIENISIAHDWPGALVKEIKLTRKGI